MADAPESKDFRPKARRARGLMDRRGSGLAVERELIAKIAGVYEAWGFEALDTPAFEYADALGKFLPDQDRPNEGVFAFEDDDAQWLALRYDLTAPLARFVAENFDALPKPYRRWAAGPVWRNEKPGPGRYREFWQCDADTVGSASPAADAEMIAMACAALEAAGVQRGGYRLNVSDRRIVEAAIEICVPAELVNSPSARLVILRTIDKADRLGAEGLVELLGAGRRDPSGDFTPGAGLPDYSINRLLGLVFRARRFFTAESQWSNAVALQMLSADFEESAIGSQAVSDLRQIADVLDALGIDDRQWRVDTSIVRGLEYYTGTVFEAELVQQFMDVTGRAVSFGSVGGGGRYDDLVSRFRGEKIPATGFSIGVSRLAAALQASKAGAAEVGPVIVLVMDAARAADSFAMAAELRAAGVRAEAYLGAGGMKAQLKYADKRTASVAVIQGGDELAKGVVTLKDLRLGAALSEQAGEDREAWTKAREQLQREIPRAQLVAGVRDMLARS